MLFLCLEKKGLVACLYQTNSAAPYVERVKELSQGVKLVSLILIVTEAEGGHPILLCHFILSKFQLRTQL